MKIKEDGIMLCSDCTIVACNGLEGVVLADQEATINGLYGLGKNLVPNFDSETGQGVREFSSIECRACGTTKAGYRAEFAILE